MLRAGDTVTVEDGTYAGFQCDGVSGTAAARITVLARNRWGAKITSASASSTQDAAAAAARRPATAAPHPAPTPAAAAAAAARAGPGPARTPAPFSSPWP